MLDSKRFRSYGNFKFCPFYAFGTNATKISAILKYEIVYKMVPIHDRKLKFCTCKFLRARSSNINIKTYKNQHKLVKWIQSIDFFVRSGPAHDRKNINVAG